MHRGSPLLVVGGAGTGKSRVIASRFLALVAEGSAPERLLVLTPTAATAEALRARLERSLERGYEELCVETPLALAARLLDAAGWENDALSSVLGAGDRLAMLLGRIDELPLRHHDFGGSATALLGGFVRRIDRLKAELVTAEDYAHWAGALAEGEDGALVEAPDGGASAALEQEFAEVYRAHERMLGEASARDAGDVLREALRMVHERPGTARRFEHVLIDDAHDFDLAAASLARAVAVGGLTAAGDPRAALRRFRGAGAARLRDLAVGDTHMVSLDRGLRCPERVARAASVLAASPQPDSPPVARSRSGAAPTTARRPSRWPPTWSG